ncbi:hypothetical protein F4819DRAFT_463223 [Hypoxylon fuscum]|nr:hypothetical protein F4819DRAFT_463223 [Hypoxylon fuscum]
MSSGHAQYPGFFGNDAVDGSPQSSLYGTSHIIAAMQPFATPGGNQQFSSFYAQGWCWGSSSYAPAATPPSSYPNTSPQHLGRASPVSTSSMQSVNSSESEDEHTSPRSQDRGGPTDSPTPRNWDRTNSPTNETESENSRTSRPSQRNDPSATESSPASEIDFLGILRRHVHGLSGSELREIILSVCLKSQVTYNGVANYVKRKETEKETVVQYGSDGLGIHLQYFSPMELEELVLHIWEKDRYSTRSAIEHLVQTIEGRKMMGRALT